MASASLKINLISQNTYIDKKRLLFSHHDLCRLLRMYPNLEKCFPLTFLMKLLVSKGMFLKINIQVCAC